MIRLPKGVRRLFALERDPSTAEDDVRTEIEFHVESRVRELVARGMPRDDARREAESTFGDMKRIERDLLRGARRSEPRRRLSGLLGDVRQDAVFALRTLRAAPGYTFVAVLTLGLGIGANTAVFTLVDGVLLSPLPYENSERLVTLWSSSPSRGLNQRSPVSYPDFRDWRAQAASFEGMAMLYGHGAVLREREGLSSVVVAAVSGEYFEILRARTILGAPFTQNDIEVNPRVAVLKYGTWQRRYGGDPDIVGRTITLDGLAYTVVGVTDRGHDFPMWGELWIPLSRDLVAGQNLEHRGQRIDTWVLARLRPGIDSTAATAELQAIAQRLSLEYPETNTDWSVVIAPLRQIVIDPFGRNATIPRSLALLNGAVALVLLIACANVANISLARVLHRGREFAVRAALGAGRWRVVRQLLTESLLVSITGAVVGMIVANWAVSFILARGPALPRTPEIAIDLRVLGFAVALAAGTTILFGIIPAFRGAGARLTALRGGAHGVIGTRGGRRLQSVLVGTQVGLALLLLVGAGLLIGTLRNLQQVDPGFDPSDLLVMRVEAPSPPYSSDEQLVELHRRLERAVESTPGVTGAATANHAPGGGMVISPFESPDLDTVISVAFRTASPDYIETMGIPILEGRTLSHEDMAPWSGALLVNRRLAAILDAPLGKRVTVFKQKPGPDFGAPLHGEIVGVVEDVLGSLAQRQSPYTVYLPFTLNPWQSATLVVRTAPDVTNPAALVRETLAGVDPNLPLVGLRAMQAQLHDSLSQQRFAVLLMSSFALAALLLAALGIYGVLAYLVRQRSREISVRMALGAGRNDVVRLVVTRAMIMVALGGIAGLVAAWALTRVMSSLLFGVSTTDPATFGGVTAVLIAVALLASYLPAKRAAGLDPMSALREE